MPMSIVGARWWSDRSTWTGVAVASPTTRSKYNPLGSDFVNPNLDVAYFEAWFAVDDRTPVLLEIPEIKGRYYTVQILDEWGEVIANINERTFPSQPYGKFVLVKPASEARSQLMLPASNCTRAKPKCLAAWRLKATAMVQFGFNSSSRLQYWARR